MIKKLSISKEKLFDGAVDLSLDVLLILIDILSAPIVLPARLAAHCVKKLAKAATTREARRYAKKSIAKWRGKASEA